MCEGAVCEGAVREVLVGILTQERCREGCGVRVAASCGGGRTEEAVEAKCGEDIGFVFWTSRPQPPPPRGPALGALATFPPTVFPSSLHALMPRFRSVVSTRRSFHVQLQSSSLAHFVSLDFSMKRKRAVAQLVAHLHALGKRGEGLGGRPRVDQLLRQLIYLPPVQCLDHFRWAGAAQRFATAQRWAGFFLSMFNIWSEQKRRQKKTQSSRSKQLVVPILATPPRMGAASAAYCALSAGSKPIEEVPKVQRSYRPGRIRMGPGRPGSGMPGRT